MLPHGAFLLPVPCVALRMAIVKILSRHGPSCASLIRYILRYIVDERKVDDKPVYAQNLRSSSVSGYVREFVENEAFRRHSRSDQIHLFHEIVSFHADESREAITPAMTDDLAHEYMRLRGDTGVMLGSVHRDREHVHIHFCVSALHYRTGKSFGLNKRQLRELKQSFQDYHKQHFPELTKSFPAHGRGGISLTHAQWHAKRRDEITHTVRQCFDRSATQNEFLALLRDANLHHYERGGIPAGVTHGGVKLRFSRLLEGREIEALPVERGGEERALAEIWSIRERRCERDHRSHSMEDRER